MSRKVFPLNYNNIQKKDTIFQDFSKKMNDTKYHFAKHPLPHVYKFEKRNDTMYHFVKQPLP